MESSKETEANASKDMEEKQAQVEEVSANYRPCLREWQKLRQTSSLAEQLSVAEQEVSDAAATERLVRSKSNMPKVPIVTQSSRKEQKQGSS